MGETIDGASFKKLAGDHHHKKAKFCFESFAVSELVAAEIQQHELWPKLNYLVADGKRVA